MQPAIDTIRKKKFLKLYKNGCFAEPKVLQNTFVLRMSLNIKHSECTGLESGKC